MILIGHAGHPEVEGTMGQFDDARGGRINLVEDVADVEPLEVRDPARVGFVTQTTLSVDDTADVLDALRERFPTLLTPRKEDICYATQNRQDAVKTLVANCDVVVVVGSQTARTPTACARLPRRPASRATWSTAPTTSSEAGSRVDASSASRPAPRRRRCWCSAWWRGSGNGAARAPRRLSVARRAWCSRCPGSCARHRVSDLDRPAGTHLLQHSRSFAALLESLAVLIPVLVSWNVLQRLSRFWCCVAMAVAVAVQPSGSAAVTVSA